MHDPDTDVIDYFTIVEILAEIMPYTKNQVRSTIDGFLRIVQEAAYSGKRVRIHSFGSFYLAWVRSKRVFRFKQAPTARIKMRLEQEKRGVHAYYMEKPNEPTGFESDAKLEHRDEPAQELLRERRNLPNSES